MLCCMDLFCVSLFFCLIGIWHMPSMLENARFIYKTKISGLTSVSEAGVQCQPLMNRLRNGVHFILMTTTVWPFSLNIVWMICCDIFNIINSIYVTYNQLSIIVFYSIFYSLLHLFSRYSISCSCILILYHQFLSKSLPTF